MILSTNDLRKKAAVSQAVKYSEQDYLNVEAGRIKVLYIDYVNLLQKYKSTLTPKLYFLLLL